MTKNLPMSSDEDGKATGQLPLGFWTQIAVFGRGLGGSPERWTLLWLAVSVFAVILLTAAAQVALNAWNGPFYNAISARDDEAFLHELVVFFEIAGSLLVLNVVQMWLNLMMQLKLRAGLMHDLLGRWLEPLNAFRLAHAGNLGVNPDQRLHEDARHLSELSTSLAVGLLQASVLLAVFVVVLWRLSEGFVFTVGGHTIAIPGYMVWAAALYALAGSLASFRVGYSLIRFNAERYAREAELRHSLVSVSDQIGTIALHRGEANERRRLNEDLTNVLAAMRKLVTAATRLTWVTAGYGWLTQVVPILVASPVYFTGHISFGGLMVAVGAFNQVQSSLRWFVDNFSTIADWRATLVRVSEFRRAVIDVDDVHRGSGRIEIETGEPGRLVLDNFAVATPNSCTRLKERHVEIASGERVAVVGDSGDAQTLFFRALAGLWPWGSGCIRLPGEETFLHVARRPYIRPGRLSEILAYPYDPEVFDKGLFKPALEAIGLDDLASRLEEAAAWDQDLGDQDQQRLAFARLLVQKPQWIIIDQALEALDDRTREQVVGMLETTLKSAAVINIGRTGPDAMRFSQTLELVDGACRGA